MAGRLKILNATGHAELAWEEVTDKTRTEAEALFADALAKGGTPFEMDGDNVGKKIEDNKLPETGTIVVAPRLVGG